MKSIFLYIWQLPQNIIGLLVILFTGAKKDYRNLWISDKYNFGVSLGNYVIFGGFPNNKDVQHERGHQKQSLYLGWFYLIIIGLPSFIGNIYDRIAHKNWDWKDSYNWYYKQPWEAWADKLGGVER